MAIATLEDCVKDTQDAWTSFMSSFTQQTILIEAAHVYVDIPPGKEEWVGAVIGNHLAGSYELMGCTVKKMLFVDDYTWQFKEGATYAVDIANYTANLKSIGFHPDVIAWEALLVPVAGKALEMLLMSGHAHETDEGILLTKGKVMLYDKSKGKYGCALLDACLYVAKLTQADLVITILPHTYQGEQKDTFAILKRLGEDTSRIKIGYYGTGTVTPVQYALGLVDMMIPLVDVPT